MASFYYPLGVGNVLAVSTAPRACRTLDRGRCRAVPRGVGVVTAACGRVSQAGPLGPCIEGEKVLQGVAMQHFEESGEGRWRPIKSGPV